MLQGEVSSIGDGAKALLVRAMASHGETDTLKMIILGLKIRNVSSGLLESCGTREDNRGDKLRVLNNRADGVGGGRSLDGDTKFETPKSDEEDVDEHSHDDRSGEVRREGQKSRDQREEDEDIQHVGTSCTGWSMSEVEFAGADDELRARCDGVYRCPRALNIVPIGILTSGLRHSRAVSLRIGRGLALFDQREALKMPSSLQSP